MSGEDKLGDAWRVRNAAAQTLTLAEDQMRRAVREATVEELAAFIDCYSPALSTGPEWTRTFDPLIERLWAWRDDQTMAALAAIYKARGVPWAAVANALAPEQGARLKAEIRQPHWARMPAFGVA